MENLENTEYIEIIYVYIYVYTHTHRTMLYLSDIKKLLWCDHTVHTSLGRESLTVRLVRS